MKLWWSTKTRAVLFGPVRAVDALRGCKILDVCLEMGGTSGVVFQCQLDKPPKKVTSEEHSLGSPKRDGFCFANQATNGRTTWPSSSLETSAPPPPLSRLAEFNARWHVGIAILSSSAKHVQYNRGTSETLCMAPGLGFLCALSHGLLRFHKV